MTNEVQKQKPLSKPSNEIDLQALTTTPFISSDYMSDRIRNKFREFSYVLDKDGKPVLDDDGNPQLQITKDLWATMELFTQDFRLGNLNKDERYYVKYHIDMCTDTLTVLPDRFNKPALLMLSRATSELETSSSKSGFLRRLFNTFFQHSSVKEDAPTKRSFFGLGKKNKVE
jgi:hypothetical protein